MRPEEILSGGAVNHVTRVGDTVRRPTGPWTPAVHADLPASVAMRPWPAVLLGDDGLRRLGHALRLLSEATADFTPPPGARWRTDALPAPAGPIRHGDLGPWNTLWDGERLVGIIDWDFAEPAPPLWDLAQTAWYTGPLRGGDVWRASGFPHPPDHRHRFRVLCDAYGADPAAVLNALEEMQALERHRTSTLGRAGVAPFAAFLERGDLDEFDRESAWLARHRARR